MAQQTWRVIFSYCKSLISYQDLLLSLTSSVQKLKMFSFAAHCQLNRFLYRLTFDWFTFLDALSLWWGLSIGMGHQCMHFYFASITNLLVFTALYHTPLPKANPKASTFTITYVFGALYKTAHFNQTSKPILRYPMSVPIHFYLPIIKGNVETLSKP